MHVRRHARAAFAGPKALAVLSCALALLTAQPWAARGEDVARPAAVRAEGAGHPASVTATSVRQAIYEVRTAVATVARREAARAQARAEIHARLHATWAVIAKLLAGDTSASRPAGGVLADLDVAQATAVVGVAGGVPFCTEHGRQWAGQCGDLPAPPPAERRFAIEHCLLAPPC